MILRSSSLLVSSKENVFISPRLDRREFGNRLDLTGSMELHGFALYSFVLQLNDSGRGFPFPFVVSPPRHFLPGRGCAPFERRKYSFFGLRSGKGLKRNDELRERGESATQSPVNPILVHSARSEVYDTAKGARECVDFRLKSHRRGLINLARDF